MRTWVRSLASLSGLSISCCHELWCRSKMQLPLLWLWYRPAATAPVRPLAWEPPCTVGAALGVALKGQKKITVIKFPLVIGKLSPATKSRFEDTRLKCWKSAELRPTNATVNIRRKRTFPSLILGFDEIYLSTDRLTINSKKWIKFYSQGYNKTKYANVPQNPCTLLSQAQRYHKSPSRWKDLSR